MTPNKQGARVARKPEPRKAADERSRKNGREAADEKVREAAQTVIRRRERVLRELEKK